MITVPAGARVYLAAGRTDMRKGMNGLSLLVQEVLDHDPFSGALFVFRGRRGDLADPAIRKPLDPLALEPTTPAVERTDGHPKHVGGVLCYGQGG